MSRIGKLPVELPSGVTVEVNGNVVTARSSKGELTQEIQSKLITVKVEDNLVIIERKNDSIEAKAKHGLYRSLIANMVEGLDKGFSKILEINGVGYRANLQGKKLVLSLGFSHPIEFTTPEGITIEIDEKNKNQLKISGIDKQKVGQVAAKIRSFKKPEPYKGKGIKYIDEHIVRKAGKAAAKAE
jgi:large subunit ribosomal protein L6